MHPHMHPSKHPPKPPHEATMPSPRFPGFRLALLLCACMLWGAPAARAGEAAPASDDPALEARVMAVAAELRCLVCQNQTIADSHAELAVDLRNQVREMLRRGDSREQIVAYMTARYGDFVLYRPPLKESTALLWFGPALLMVAGLVVLVVVLRRRAKLPDASFELDEDAPDPKPAAGAPTSAHS
jgi:cytochrome c-type biogenesis protein CcmH